MYGCESWPTKKAEHRKIDALQLWCWRRLLEKTLENPLDCKEIRWPKGWSFSFSNIHSVTHYFGILFPNLKYCVQQYTNLQQKLSFILSNGRKRTRYAVNCPQVCTTQSHRVQILVTHDVTRIVINKGYNRFSSVAQLCPTLCDPMDCSTPGLPVHHQLLELTQTHVHQVSYAVQPSHPLLSPSPAFNLSQDQGLFQWVSSSHQVAKVLAFQHQSFQWIFRTDFL